MEESITVTWMSWIIIILISTTRADILEGDICHKSEEVKATIDDKWKLFCFGDPTILLYPDQDTEEYLNLCGPPDEDPECADDCIPNCNELRLKALQFGKGKVVQMRLHVFNSTRAGLLWTLWVIIAIIGLVLFTVGQFRLSNLPIVGDQFLDDPTDGIKYYHYRWMRWIILGNKNRHWLTYIVPDAFIYRWTPLSKRAFDRPPPPPNQRALEPKESDYPPWIIEDIILERQQGLDGHELEPSWNVLEDYWMRIYTSSWSRYRHQSHPEILQKSEIVLDASHQNLQK